MPAAPHRPSLAVVLAALIALAAPAVARAGFFGGDVIDGPSADIVSVGDLDVSHDGGGAVVYLKRDGAIEHLFASRLVDGAWTPPERLDPGFVTPSSSPVVAVSDGGRVAVAFVNAGQLFTILRPAGATSWPAPVPVPGPGVTPDIDMSINGTAYVVWTAGADVRAARADRTETGFTPLDTPLDVDPSRTAGSSTGRPRVAVSADGTAAATWGEGGHVFVRRLFGMRVSDSPQDATVTDFAGHAGSTADTPDIDMWDDSSFAWVTFRQMFADGTRVLARRLAGSELEPAVDVSGGGFGGENADAPRLDVNGRGETVFANETTGSNTPFSTLVHLDAVGSPVAPAGAQAVPPQPQPAIGENGDAVVAWLQSAGGGDAPSVHGRFFKEALPAGDGVLSNPAFGGVDPAAGFDADADRTGNVAVVYVQGSGDQRRLVAGAWDRPPSTFTANTTSHWRRPVPLRWSPAIDLWGPLTYTVVFDGKPLVTTPNTTSPSTTILPDGRHRWRVIATDRRGQSTSSRLRELLIDGNPPLVRLKISGRRAAGSRVRLASRAFDRGSGLRLVRFDFGDNTPTVLGTTVTHFFRRGRFTVTVTAVDRAGNRAVVTRRIHIS